jgi:hypothetical protein
VREVWIEGVAPTIDAPDGYTLTARWGPPLPDWEVEPNDSPAAATPLPASGRVRGYLGTPEDKDWFTITLDRRGKVPATVEAPAGVDVVVFLDEQGKRVIDRHSAGEREELTLDAEPGRPLLIGVGRKLDPKKDPKEQALAALDDPYEIKIDVAGGN